MEIKDAVELMVKQYAQSELTPLQINCGFCEEFARQVVSLYNRPYMWLDSDNFTDAEQSAIDWHLVDNHWNGRILSDEQRAVVDLRITSGHSWLYVNGRHYDAQAPEGVENFFDLPFFRLNRSLEQ